MHKQFIWIMTDSTGYNMVSCNGFPEQFTPNIDSMAASGLRFERTYTCQPVCGPARSALFTGRYPHSNGSWGNSMPLGADEKTIGQRLSAAGIAAGYIGKWHLDAGDYFGNGICPDGWQKEYWYDMKNYLDELTDEEKVMSRDTMMCKKGIPASFTFGHRVTDRALRFIDEHKDEDFFLVVSYDEPHDPCLCPEPYASMYADREAVGGQNPSYEDDLSGKPLLQKLWARHTKQEDPASRWKGLSTCLCACNAYIDSEIGRVLEKARTDAPDSMRMYTSDHGDGAGAHGLFAKGPSVYDEIARVPLLFEGPDVTHGTYPHTVSHIDLPATVLDFFGLRRPVLLEGQSILPQLRDPELPTDRPAFVEFTRYEIDHDGFGGFQPMRAVITDDMKLEVNLLDTDELYDINKDPYNNVNLINDPAYAEKRNELHDRIIDWMNRTRDPFRGYQWEARPWRPEIMPCWKVDGYTRQRENDPGEYRQKDYCTGLTMTEAQRNK